MRYIDIPSKLLTGEVSSVIEHEVWPYPSTDPYWIGGSSPRAYRWKVEFSVEAQPHSSPLTRQPLAYTGSDIKVGDYIAHTTTGAALKVISIESQSDDHVSCIVEDVLRYNTFRDPSRNGIGIFPTPASIVIFETNDDQLPILEINDTIGSSFYAVVMSRFQNMDANSNFLLNQEAHGFVTGDLISADPANNGFAKTDPAHPFLIGTVTYNDLGPNAFMVNPIQKVVDDYDYLPGEVGDIIYADPNNAGKFSLAGTTPVMIKLRQQSKSFIAGSVTNPVTYAGSALLINGVEATVNGEGTISDIVDAFNLGSDGHGVTAVARSTATVAMTDVSTLAYGEPLIIVGPQAVTATINGVLVTFSTTTAGAAEYGPGFSLEQDIVADINAANIPNLVATVADGGIRLEDVAGGQIEIVNGQGDSNATPFAGPNSMSGLPLLVEASEGQHIYLEAVDARAIRLFDSGGSVVFDCGLRSVENGDKAAALYIEQGIRQAATYVVADIPARDAINALFGDQCFVQDKGNGEWGHYIRTLSNIWVKIADKDSSESDAQTVEIEITHETDVSGVIYTVSGGSRVTFVTVTVTEQFNGLNPIITVGDGDDNARLMTGDQNDLTSLGAYSTTPSYIYSGQEDVDITFTFNAANSTSGKAVIVISYT